MNALWRRLCLLLGIGLVLGMSLSVAETEMLQDDTPPFSRWIEADGITEDWFGMRTQLSDHGIDIFGGYTAEVWGNTTGGVNTGAVYTGMLDFGTELDLEKIMGWKGAKISTTWLWISGQDASADLVGNFLTISNIAGFNTLRMMDLWFQQNLLDDKISIRLGQMTADAEFVISDYGALFINGTFGWPAFMYLNTPNGGPGYPMGTLGGRVAVNPVDWFTFQSAVFQGNVYEQNVNRHGFRWGLNGQNGFFFINEAQFRWNHRDTETGLPGQLKAGFWAQTGEMADMLTDSTTSGNYGYYFIMDQMVFREPSADAAPASDGKSVRDGKSAKTVAASAKSDQGLGWFGRLSFQSADRNIIGFYFDTGLTYKGLIPSRDDDTLGVGFAYAQLTGGGRSIVADDLDTATWGAEMVLEVTYQAQITPWLSIQPDVQYIINPGALPEIPNALVIGARAAITF